MPPQNIPQSHGRAESIAVASAQSGDGVNDAAGDRQSTSVQAQSLLTALYNVIVPLVQTALPSYRDLDHIPLTVGSEAEDLLTALQKYITCVIRDHIPSGRRDGLTRTVDAGETSSMINEKVFERSIDVKARDEGVSDVALSSMGRSETQPQHQDSNSLDDALTALRVRVFNEMPMRLLAFEKHGSQFDITLLDRTGIYLLLASKLEDKARSVPFDTASAATWVPEIATYAILSHTWLRSAPGEVTFGDWQRGVVDEAQPGYQKLEHFCRVAEAEHGLALGWMDTVCINKDSSAELDESLRSMYKWYRNAAVCIAYLAETRSVAGMARDPWFTRGWTLQELLAPFVIRFYGAHWRPLRRTSTNDKLDPDIHRQIECATTITPIELMSAFLAPVSRRMQWAARREVTRAEDAAYALMGLFDVNMSIAYGEGAERAFVRLLKAILGTAKHKALDVFNWGGDYGINESALLPSSPEAYLRRCELSLGRTVLIEPLAITHLGLRIPVLLLPAVPVDTSGTRHSVFAPVGDYSAAAHMDPISAESAVPSGSYAILHAEAVRDGVAGFGHRGACGSVAFAVLNCGGDETDVRIPVKCFAIAILHTETVGKATGLGNNPRIPTKDPVVFSLNHRRENPRYPVDYHNVQRSQLARHGMQMLVMYM